MSNLDLKEESYYISCMRPDPSVPFLHVPIYFRYDNQVRHIRVEKNLEGLFYLADTKFFSSLPVSILALFRGIIARYSSQVKNSFIKLRTSTNQKMICLLPGIRESNHKCLS